MIVDRKTLKQIAQTWKQEIIDGYERVSHDITSVEDDDGGGHYTDVIRNVKTGKFYKMEWCDWDISNGDDINNDLVEVFPIQIVTTIYIENPDG